MRRPLADRGWDTLAIVPDEPGNARERLLEEGVDVIALPMGRLRASLDPRWQARFVGGLVPDIRAIRGLLRARDVDLLQTHGVTQIQGPLAAHREGIAVVWELYDTRAPMFLRRALMPLVTRVSDVITTWGRELALVHPGAESLGDRLVTVFPPVDAREFRPDRARRAEARRMLGVPNAAPLVGSVGNLNPMKGHEYLVEAGSVLRERHPDARFRVIGAPGAVHTAYYDALSARVRDRGLEAEGRFEFVGPVSGVAEVMPAFDVLTITSVPRSEGMPTVILEAMACGIPVVTTDVGASREVVEDGVTGFVVPPEDVDALATALGRLIADQGLCRRMGEVARERAVVRFDLERCADRRVHAFELALAHRRHR